MKPLEILVRPDNLVDVDRDIRSQNFRGNRPMIFHRYDSANVMTQRRDHQFFGRSAADGTSGGLQAVVKLVNRKTFVLLP
jgi:hypothetical protein